MSLLNAPEQYVRAWTPWVGGRALAEGEIPCPSVFHVPACLCRFDVRFFTRPASSLGASGFLVIEDNRSPLSSQSR